MKTTTVASSPGSLNPKFAAELGEAIKEQINDPQQSMSSINVGSGFNNQLIILSSYSRELRALVGQACETTAWGGRLITGRSKIKDAVRFFLPQDFKPYDPANPDHGIAGQCLFSLLRQFDNYLRPHDQDASYAPISDALDRLIEARKQLLQYRDLLLSYPVVLFGGYPEARASVENYLRSYSNLLSIFCANESTLHAHDEQATKFVSSELLRLDVIHIKTPSEWKAILTPFHPFYLWRFKEIIQYIHRKDQDLTDEEKQLLTESLPKLPHLLHFIFYVSGTDDIRLPQSGAIELLPTYENRTNRYLGNDGLHFLYDLLRRWYDYAPYSRPQIRVALVDVPDLRESLTIVADFLMKNSPSTTIIVDTYSTRGQNIQGELARLDYDGQDHQLGELIQRNRLSIHTFLLTNSQDVALALKNRPVHIAFLFDQSEYALQEAPRAQQLVVSPLVVTYEYDYSENFHRGNISPSAEAQDGLFNHYHQLVKWAANLAAGQQLRLRYEGEDDLSHINNLLSSDATRWLVIADRVLTPYRPEAAVPLSEQRFGQREVGVWTGASSQAALRILDVLRRYNLQPDRAIVAKILNDFGHIAAGGVFSLPMVGGNIAARQSSEKGLLGTLIAAAWYTKEYPGSLIASLDSSLARQWLRLRVHGNERADLIGLRVKDGGIVIEPIEVKSRADSSAAHTENDPVSGQKRLVGHAIEQLDATLDAIRPIFGGEDYQPLFTPARREVLKYQVFRECFRDVHDYGWQKSWYSLLKDSFNVPPKHDVECRGIVLHIMLENSGGTTEVLDATKPLRLIEIGTRTIQTLVGNLPTESPESSIIDTEVVVQPVPTLTQPVNLVNNEQPVIDSNPREVTGLEHIEEITPPAYMPPIDRHEVDQLVHLFLRACQSYRIQVERCDPDRVVAGPTVWRLYVRLARGQRLDPLRNVLEDIGREMGRSGLIVTLIPNSQDIALDVPRAGRLRVELVEVLDKLPQVDSVEEMPIPIGVTPEGDHIIRDLGKMPHLLVGGTTGSGKSMFLYSLLCALIKTHPDKKSLRLFLSTSGAEDFVFFDNLPHLETGEVITDAKIAVDLLQTRITNIFEERQNILTNARCRDIIEYNKRFSEKLPPLVVVVDEFADLTDQFGSNRQAKESFYRTVRQIAQIGRKRGVHLILCTQRPSADLVPTNIRNLLNGRVALHVNDAAASRMILDESGAEQLQMHGDLLFKEQGALIRAQGYYVTTDFLENLIQSVQS